MNPKKRSRQERAIVMMEKQVALHESNADFTRKILEDKDKLDGKTDEQIEKIRKTKLERVKTSLENTKTNLR
tara:strand:- start:113 stop:328 length:216 start_codon:yes stop_codon:yes gene_type:complete